MTDTTVTARQCAATSDDDLTHIIHALRTYAKREWGIGSHVPNLMDGAADALARLREENTKLLGFVRDLMDGCWPDGGFDGFELQETAEKHGILLPETRTEPCGDDCSCAEVIGRDEFPVTCYRLAEFVRNEHGS